MDQRIFILLGAATLFGLWYVSDDNVTPTPAGVYIVSRITGSVEFCSPAGCHPLRELPTP